ncbi:MAG: hypothetical protein V2B18_22315 [Pseudomonadota bacterium]
MKAFVVLAVFLSLILTAQTSFAKANHRGAIDRKWKKEMVWQKKQNDQIRRIEREAERSLRDLRGQDGPAQRIPYPDCRTCP